MNDPDEQIAPVKEDGRPVAAPTRPVQKGRPLAANQTQENLDEIIDWLDMSRYGVYLGIIKLPGGERRSLVLVDEAGTNERFARALGFKRARLDNVWFNERLKFTVPGELRRLYPQMRAVRITRSERWETLKQKLSETVARQHRRPDGERPGWHPQHQVAGEAAAAEPKLSVAIKQTLFCGLNARGQEVIENVDGARQLRNPGSQRVLESEKDGIHGGPEFLRATSAADAAALHLIAQGLLIEMQRTKLRSADFGRYLNAALGEGAAEQAPAILAFHGALDRAIFERLGREAAEVGTDDAYRLARSFHEMRPPFFRPAGTHPTPAPISAALQTLVLARTASTREAGTAITVLDVSAGEVPQHTWMLGERIGAESVTADATERAHDCLIGGVFGSSMAETHIEGLSIARADHRALIASLTHRADDGFTALAISPDSDPGVLEADTKRLVAWIGERFEIAGLVDLDASMVGEGVASGTRLVAIGPRRAKPIDVFQAPSRLPVLFDYDELADWTKGLIADNFRTIEEFGEIRRANKLQAPYVPFSQVSEPISMSPRNLLAPTRKALARLVAEEGMSVDRYVASKLGMDLDELGSGIFNAEQVDAIALGIRAIDADSAFVIADQTGLGKGRILAALATYAGKSGRPTLFATEKTELYADFYRDVTDIGAARTLDNPFLLNTSGGVSGMDGTTDLYPPTPPETVLEVCRSGVMPARQGPVLATYSIFNRAPATAIDVETADSVDDAVVAVLSGAPFDEIPKGYRLLKIGNAAYRQHLNDAQGERLSGAALTARIEAIAAYRPDPALAGAPRLYSHDAVESAKRELALRDMKPKALAQELERLHRLPLNAWRGYWAQHSDALKDAVLLLDESHKAAGPSSQTGDNVRAMAGKAGATIFSSATFAKDERNLALYARVFPKSVNADEIATIVTRGGEPLREILTGMLAEDGLMIRREHDISAMTFKAMPDLARQDLNRARKDAVAEVLMQMATLAGEIKSLVQTQNQANKSNSKAFTFSYSGPFSRFYAISRTFAAAVGAEHCADIAIAALRNNQKPVLTIESTMESVIKDMIEMSGARERPDGTLALGRNLSFRDLLHRYADNMFNVYEIKRDGRKVVSKKRVSIAPAGMGEQVQAIHDQIDKLSDDIPISPIDAMRERIEAAGYSFDEISGRKMRLSSDMNGNQYIEKIVDTGKGASIRTAGRFNAGELDVLLLTLSGNSGISLQASERFLDQRQRVLIEAQPASDILQRVQFFGRVFRLDHVCPPEYLLPSSGLSYDRRLAMIQNASSRRMSASVTGNSENPMLDASVPEIMNSIGNEVCYNWLESRPDMAVLMNITLRTEREASDETGELDEEYEAQSSGDENRYCGTEFVDKLTGRLFMLQSHQEEKAWQEIYAEYRTLIEQCEAQGYNPLKSSEHDIRAKKCDSLIFESVQHNDARESVFNKPVLAVELEFQQQYKAMDIKPIAADIEVAKARFKTEQGDMKTVLKTVIDESKKKGMELARSLDFPSLEAALMAEKHNRVKSFMSRSATMRDALSCIGMPGQVVMLGKAAAVVLDLQIPKERAHWTSPSMWNLRVLFPEERRIKEVTLGSAMSTVGPSWHVASAMLEHAASTVTHTHRRVVLEGNLFAASRICARMKKGEAVSYSDDRGVWHQAFMLPGDMSLRHLKHMEISLNDPDLAYDLLFEASTASRPVMLSNSFDAKEQLYKVYAQEDGRLEIMFVKKERKADINARKALMSDEMLKGLSADGKTVGFRGARRFNIPAENAKPALERLIEVAARAGVPLTAAPFMREWIEERRQRIVEAAQAGSQRSAALAADLGL